MQIEYGRAQWQVQPPCRLDELDAEFELINENLRQRIDFLAWNANLELTRQYHVARRHIDRRYRFATTKLRMEQFYGPSLAEMLADADAISLGKVEAGTRVTPDLVSELWAKQLLDQYKDSRIFFGIDLAAPPPSRWVRLKWRWYDLVSRVQDAWGVLTGRLEVE